MLMRVAPILVCITYNNRPNCPLPKTGVPRLGGPGAGRFLFAESELLTAVKTQEKLNSHRQWAA